jgi:hypothetical protein
MSSYLTIQRVWSIWVGDYLPKTIHCHCHVLQGSHFGLLFFIADIDDVSHIFENFRVNLAYDDDLLAVSTDDYRLFKRKLKRLQIWCREKKFHLNAGIVDRNRCCFNTSIMILRVLMRSMTFVLSVLIHNRIIFVDHIAVIGLKSARMLGFIKQI